MTRKPRSALLWLRDRGPLIDKDAEVQTSDTKAGHCVTFSFAYDHYRSVRISFSNVTSEERKELLTPGLKP